MKTRRRRVILRGTGKQDFPYKKSVKYDGLIVTEEGEYSMTKRKDGELLLSHMKTLIKSMKTKTITDLTGNVGSDTILFALHFKHVHSIEMNHENFEALQNNIKTFKLKNVTLYEGDSTKLYDWDTDVLYIDAPWGGPDYKSKKSLDLYLGHKRLDVFVKEVLNRENKPSYIFLKLPRNYNFDRFDFQYQVFRIRGYYLVSIKTDF